MGAESCSSKSTVDVECGTLTAVTRRLFVLLNDVDAAAFSIELYVTIDQREKRVVVALPDAASSVEFVAYLTDQNVPGSDNLATELLYTTPLGVGITTVPTGTLTFFPILWLV